MYERRKKSVKINRGGLALGIWVFGIGILLASIQIIIAILVLGFASFIIAESVENE